MFFEDHQYDDNEIKASALCADLFHLLPDEAIPHKSSVNRLFHLLLYFIGVQYSLFMGTSLTKSKVKGKKRPHELPRAVSFWAGTYATCWVRKKSEIFWLLWGNNTTLNWNSLCLCQIPPLRVVHSPLTYPHLDAVNIPHCWCTHQHMSGVECVVVQILSVLQFGLKLYS